MEMEAGELGHVGHCKRCKHKTELLGVHALVCPSPDVQVPFYTQTDHQAHPYPRLNKIWPTDHGSIFWTT